MSPSQPGHWFLIEEYPVEGLGYGELLQSTSNSSDFQAKLCLNSYESNCLRDWLSQRWLAKSLEQTCIFKQEESRLVILKVVSAASVPDAKEKFRVWLQAVMADRIKSAQSRR